MCFPAESSNFQFPSTSVHSLTENPEHQDMFLLSQGQFKTRDCPSQFYIVWESLDQIPVLGGFYVDSEVILKTANIFF